MVKNNKSLISMIKGIKLKDAGYKEPKSSYDSPCVGTTGERINYPNIYLNIKNAPDLKGYETGDEVTLIVKGSIVGHDKTKRKNYERETFDIEIKKLTCLKK